MLKTLPQKSKKSSHLEPKDQTLFAILNYSKSISKINLKQEKVLLNLN
jgi:hypothetical protein